MDTDKCAQAPRRTTHFELKALLVYPAFASAALDNSGGDRPLRLASASFSWCSQTRQTAHAAMSGWPFEPCRQAATSQPSTCLISRFDLDNSTAPVNSPSSA